jgi:hypothetical protein
MGIRDAGRLSLAAAAVLICAGLLAPGGATAANVVNGDFENGTLQGWDVHRVNGSGDWFAYRAGTNPLNADNTGDPIAEKRGRPLPPPPQGKFAAIADEATSETLILSQEIGLGGGLEHRLNLLAYYESLSPLAVPAPDTLSVGDEALGGQANQQYRIDVMRPGSPIESVDPADVLLTVFRTRPGSAPTLAPTRTTADLSAFAGQKVRLRIAVAANKDLLAGGVDDVAVESAPPGKLPPLGGKKPDASASRISFGKVKVNPANGTAVLPVKVPGAGKLSAMNARAGAKASGSKKGGKAAKLIKPVSAKAAKAGTVKLLLRPTNAARGILELKQRLRVKVAVTYKPTGAAASTATIPVVLKLVARQRR